MFNFKFLKKNKNGELVDFYLDIMTVKNGLSRLALEIGFNKIADLISKCPFDVVSDDKDAVMTDYILNVKPNPNEFATDFWKQVVLEMCREEKGCLVVQMNDGSLYRAKSFTEDSSVMNRRTFSNVVIESAGKTLNLGKLFDSDNSILFRYKNDRLLTYLEKVNEENEIAWDVAIRGLKSKLPKYKLTLPVNFSLMNKETNKPMTANDYSEKVKKDLTSDDLKVIIQSNGIDISSIESKSGLSSTDIKALKDEVFTNTAIALGIPKSVFYGEVTEKSDANNEFITYAASPIIEEINDAVNGTWLSKESYIKGDRIILNTLCIKHVDVIESAGNLDKLYSNGWCHNDVLQLLNRPTIDEEWAWERRFTKNYSKNLEGGEKDD